jgi:alpha-1,3-rhamnosyltransferase
VSEITVLVPSYNHAPFVERTLRSIFAQTLRPKKLIVIDDGSKDESVRVIERALADCPFDSQLIVQENRGLCATLNEGLRLADGELFAYISSDDVWLPDFLASRHALLAKRPRAVLAYGHAYLIDESDNVFDSTDRWSDYADGNGLQMLLYPIIPTSASVVYRRSALEKCGWNEDSILEDYELYLRLTALGEFALDSRVLSAWRIHGYNTSADFPLMMNEWLEAQRRTRVETGLTDDELEKAQTKLRFRCVADFIRNGQRRAGWSLFRQNLEGADSRGAALRMFARFFVPGFVFAGKAQLRRRSRHRIIPR